MNTSISFLAIILLCAGCTVPPAATSPTRDDPQVREQQREVYRRKAPQKLPPAAAAKPVTGEVPEPLLERVRRALVQQLGHDRLRLHRAEAVTWPSGAMGCALPGQVYTQASVNGYHVVFEADGKYWDYRLNQRGGFRHCENPGPTKRVLQYPTQ
ncbi:hypothetical protein FKG94_02755 [Exilibacterium tricleocarpae]|uniref:Lipoprotein n=1 Tax=Exilibacterium tricleocarpae TaxID=2591008 RepID=A0A545U6N1_9GAMM|nr:hypothetical protein [Exilibacterium tricleocarpae]TQV85126.1 hypothetical protein FKG94_02755 [Exilibacterium tricleocarpae]